ncbi:MAG: hypothetical protein H6818_10975 [Phycisphaerales bacterium]|nr:hypothetical protein [Phycisphaerales bacterium]MCB9863365.1 hypothetical protein [Phycisphaerales bacterium]
MFGIVVKKSEFSRIRSRAMVYAEYLGVPCKHANWWRNHDYRYWGLWLREEPSGPVASNWYVEPRPLTQEDKGNIRALITNAPELPQEFYTRVIVNHDLEYLDQFEIQLNRMRQGQEEVSG